VLDPVSQIFVHPIIYKERHIMWLTVSWRRCMVGRCLARSWLLWL